MGFKFHIPRFLLSNFSLKAQNLFTTIRTDIWLIFSANHTPPQPASRSPCRLRPAAAPTTPVQLSAAALGGPNSFCHKQNKTDFAGGKECGTCSDMTPLIIIVRLGFALSRIARRVRQTRSVVFLSSASSSSFCLMSSCIIFVHNAKAVIKW